MSDRKITDWRGDFSLDRYSDYNLRRMCDEGIENVRSGKYVGAHFELFNTHEKSVVEEYMKDFPDINYTVDILFS